MNKTTLLFVAVSGGILLAALLDFIGGLFQLINGDATGLEPEEKELADRWIQLNRLGAPVSCEDAGFRWKHDATALGVGGTDCQTYTFLAPAVAHAHDET